MPDWYANIDKARQRLRWEPRTDLTTGLHRTTDWSRSLSDKRAYELSSKNKFGLDTRHSVTAIVACYNDAQAIPIMYDRLKKTFTALNVDHEIIFVNDCSPDDSEEVIRAVTRNDRRVIGISHSRNFGSQAAFMSGLQIASKNSCVLLDGDLQDPPGTHRTVRGPLAGGIRRGVRPPRETRSIALHAVRLQGLLPRL